MGARPNASRTIPRNGLGLSRFLDIAIPLADAVSAAHEQQIDGVTQVGTLGFENAYVLAMRDGDAERLAIQTISDLVPHAGNMEIGGDYEFFSRAEWAAVQSVYGLRFASERGMDPSLMYQAIELGNVNVITAYTTDGRIDALNLRVLDDDRDAIPPYDAVILVSDIGHRQRRRRWKSSLDGNHGLFSGFGHSVYSSNSHYNSCCHYRVLLPFMLDESCVV